MILVQDPIIHSNDSFKNKRTHSGTKHSDWVSWIIHSTDLFKNTAL